MRSQNCLELRPKLFMPTKIHPSLLGDWNPLNHQLNLVDQIQPMEKEAIEIISGMVTHSVGFFETKFTNSLLLYSSRTSILVD